VRPGAYDGGATYTLNVLRHLPVLLGDARIVVFCREGEDRIKPADNLELRPVAVRSAAGRALVETVALSRVHADVFVSPNESLPARLPAPAVVVAQNLAYHCPRSTASFRGGTRRAKIAAAAQTAYYRRRMPEAYRRSSAIVAISVTAAELLAEKAGLARERTIVALGGSDSMFLEPRPPETREPNRLLVVSAVAPYKNFELIVDVLAHLRSVHPDVRLEVAGPDWRGYRGVVEARARHAGVADALRFLGPLEPPDVADLYASSTLLLHLSECEACPLPPLEAMRSGLPVVAARRSSIPEAVGDGALLLEPTDAFEVASEIGQLLADERATASLRARGRARAEELTWARTAAGVAEGVRRAARTGH
jgi:glycosyltransferase involved in cell wall biosynthesis